MIKNSWKKDQWNFKTKNSSKTMKSNWLTVWIMKIHCQIGSTAWCFPFEFFYERICELEFDGHKYIEK